MNYFGNLARRKVFRDSLVVVIRGEIYLSTILTVLLDSEGFVSSLQVDLIGHQVRVPLSNDLFVVEIPIQRNKCFNNFISGGVFELINLVLNSLSVHCNSKTCHSAKSNPVERDRFS